MKYRNLLKRGIVTILAASMLLTGCGGGTAGEESAAVEETEENEKEEASDIKAAEGEETTEEKMSEVADSDGESAAAGNSELADALRKKYAGAEAGEFDGNVIKVDRGDSIKLEIGFNPWDGDESIYESIVFYQDAELKYPVEVGMYDYNMDDGILTIEPPYYGINEMYSTEIDLSHLSGNYLNENEDPAWGTLSQYYMASYVDLQTGEALQTPNITVVKINHEITTAPQLTFSQTDDGYAKFTWKEVPGAEGYLLFMINKDETGFWEYNDVFADVKGTEWTSDVEDHEFEESILTLNERFVQYYTSADDLAWMEENGDFLAEFELDDIAYDEYYGEYFGMVAYNSEGCSAMSNTLSAMDLAHMLPYERARFANEEFIFDIEGTLDLPATISVTMCDGSTAQKVISYDFDNIVKDESFDGYKIKAKGINTPFEDEFSVYLVNWDTLETDMAEIQDRQEKLMNKGGNVAPSLEVEEGAPEQNEEPAKEDSEPEEEEPVKAEETEEEKPEESSDAEEKSELNTEEMLEIEITANSAMSEYIALHMLETEEAIYLSDFPEAADTQQIVDAFFEAQYQNPLILGVQGGSIDPEQRILYVQYDFDKETTAKKQKAIEEKVAEIAEEIITEDMSDAEKGLAINTYLCENAYYDDAALENAEKYSFTQVDEDFYDSFTAYGILVDGVGVCASYSASFKLLADAAGLESIVVTGYLDGSVPHAWNKVKLDGDWYIVDATNNDNEMIQNALLNLSDKAAAGTLVENDSFAIDNNLYDYAAGTDELEHYHATDRFFDKEAVAGELAELLSNEGSAVLRTDYDIDDEMFYEIAQETANQAGVNLNGFYWMGVIHLVEQ
ncbi:MAG: hypothetical protein IJO65_04060 [Lachnospiraceae bacterium]|nr:hypothetical protein [Lachnospiraceae bacterium]